MVVNLLALIVRTMAHAESTLKADEVRIKAHFLRDYVKFPTSWLE